MQCSITTGKNLSLFQQGLLEEQTFILFVVGLIFIFLKLIYLGPSCMVCCSVTSLDCCSSTLITVLHYPLLTWVLPTWLPGADGVKMMGPAWGELPVVLDTESGIAAIEREQMTKPRPMDVEGPRLHQPSSHHTTPGGELVTFNCFYNDTPVPTWSNSVYCLYLLWQNRCTST